MHDHLIIEADGGSRGNPGPSGSGAVVINSGTGEILAEISRFIGTATNNVAEYTALIAGLARAYEINPDALITVRMDSKLVIEQMSGLWKIKHPDMKQLAIQAHGIINGRNVEWQWIPREQNSRADALANRAMDEGSDRVTIPPVRIASVATEFNDVRPSSVRSPSKVTESATTLLLVRHGRTALTENRRISGGRGPDPELSEAGRQDAEAIANELVRVGVDGPFAHLATPVVVVCSPMKRTLQTAIAIGRALGAEVEVLEELREISFGDWDGLTHDEVVERYGDLFEQWQGSWELSPPNGESLAEFDARVRVAKAKLLQKHAGASIVVVAHVMPIRGFLRDALDGGTAGYWRPQISPCSLTAIRVWGEQESEVQTVNYTAHLS